LIGRLSSPSGYHCQRTTYQNSHSSGEIGSVPMALPLLEEIEIMNS
jgi:hypothetical protein